MTPTINSTLDNDLSIHWICNLQQQFDNQLLPLLRPLLQHRLHHDTVPLPNTTSAVPITTTLKPPPPLKFLPPHFKIPLVPSNSLIEKRTQIVRPYKILTANTPVSFSQHQLRVQRQPLHSTELNIKFNIQLDRESHINFNKSLGLDMELNYAWNPLIKRFKLEAYHSLKKTYSITHSLFEYQKKIISAKYLTAKIQTPLVGSEH